ncbi:hypothetical protein ACWF9B_18905 [Streptomyces sp. NPDC055089]
MAGLRKRSVLLFLARVGVDVPDEARERITTCGDLETLNRRLLRAPTAQSVEDVFAEEQEAPRPLGYRYPAASAGFPAASTSTR